MAEAHDANVAGGVLLSNFPNCLDRNVSITTDNLASWATEKGIAIGASADEVDKVYGPPSQRNRVAGVDYRWVIHGDFKSGHYTDVKRPEIGDTVMVYMGGSNDLRTAEFGIRDGRVVWIFLSKNE